MAEQTVNVGGQLAPQEIVGRDKLIAYLWQLLEKQSVYLTGERRMGKTSVIRDRMAKEDRAGTRFVYMDVSRAASPIEFVEKLQDICAKHFDAGKRVTSRFRLMWGKLAGAEVGGDVFTLKIPSGLAANWKALLEGLLQDLTTLDGRTILAFDELPLMLDAIKRNQTAGGEAVVIEILDTLRAVRSTESKLRMVYTGSLGLHHVLTGLREINYQNDPTNEMKTVAVEPLAQPEATELARRLLLGEKIACADVNDSAAYLAGATDGMPYYIQHVVDGMITNGGTGDHANIDRILSERLTDMRDPWHLFYYDERIGTHYPKSLHKTARAILDRLAESDTPRSFDELYDALDPRTTDKSDETFRAALRLLGMDHYVTKTEDGYRFLHPFIARVWRAIRK